MRFIRAKYIHQLTVMTSTANTSEVALFYVLQNRRRNNIPGSRSECRSPQNLIIVPRAGFCWWGAGANIEDGSSLIIHCSSVSHNRSTNWANQYDIYFGGAPTGGGPRPWPPGPPKSGTDRLAQLLTSKGHCNGFRLNIYIYKILKYRIRHSFNFPLNGNSYRVFVSSMRVRGLSKLKYENVSRKCTKTMCTFCTVTMGQVFVAFYA